jgi:hypothetical protein
MPALRIFILLVSLLPLTADSGIPFAKDPTLIKGCVSVGRNDLHRRDRHGWLFPPIRL